MNRNRFKVKRPSNIGQLNISVSASPTTLSGEDREDDVPSETLTRSKPAPVAVASSSSSASSFKEPLPSPKRPRHRVVAEETFPAHVNVTNRRKKIARGNNVDDLSKPYFERILGRCGFTFVHNGDAPHTLDQEQIFFIREMQEILEEDTYNNVGNFMKRFLLLHENDPRLFKKSLSPTKSDGYEWETEQKSLIHLLLNLTPLQPRILEFLFEKLTEHVLDEAGHQEGLDEVGWSRLILVQLCGLSQLVDSTNFTTKVLELFEIANENVIPVFLPLLPQIIYSDDQQQEVAKSLTKLLKESGNNTPLLLDSLSNLTLSDDIRESTMEHVIEMLKLCKRKFLPEVINFLLRETKGTGDLANTVNTIRNDLDLTPGGFSETQVDECKSALVKVIARLSAILHCASEAGDIGDTWLTSVTASDKVTMLDLVVLILLVQRGDPQRQKIVLSLIKSKSSAGIIKEKTLKDTFEHYGKTLSDYLESLIKIADHLLASTDRTTSHHGALWYMFMFLYIDGYGRQRVLFNVIIKVGLCDPLGTQSALWVLSELVKHHMATVLPLTAMLMSAEGLLERVHNVSLEHARQIMDILCRLAYSGHPNAEALQGDISMLIRKQLAGIYITIKRKGIVGAVMATKHLAVSADDDRSSVVESEHHSILSNESSLVLPAGHRISQAQDLIELVQASTNIYPEARGFFYDEMASMIQDQALDHRFMQWMTELMVKQFEDDYTLESEVLTQVCKDVPLSNQLLLDGDNNPIVAALGGQVLIEEFSASMQEDRLESVEGKAYPYLACSVFRLVRILKFSTERGNLDDIDALLGCGLQLPQALQGITRGGLMSITDPVEQRCILNSLFLAINWLREVVNAFTYLQEQEFADKVMQRVRHIVLLERRAAELLPGAMPNYVPPACQFYVDVLPSKHRASKTGKKKNRGRKKKVGMSSMHPALDNSEEEASSVDEESDKENDEEKEKGGSVSLAPLKAYLRELDMPIFIMLSRNFVITADIPDSDEVTPELGPPELMFLLEDYCAKLEHYLVPKAANSLSRRGPPVQQAGGQGKIGQAIAASSPLHFHLDMVECEKIVLNASRVVKHLCNKLEQIIGFFQELRNKNDGVRDGPGSDSDIAKQLSQCFLLLLRCLKATLGWNGLYTAQHRNLLCEMLQEIAGRVNDGDTKKMLLPELVSSVCRYFSKYGEFVMQLPSAVTLVSLIQVVASHDNVSQTDGEKNLQAIRKLCKNFLESEWPAVPSSGAGPLVTQLIQALIDSSEVKLVRTLSILKLVEDNVEQLKGKNAAGFIEGMPTISKSTLVSVYQVLAAGVAAGASEAAADPDHMTQSQGGNKLGRSIQAWSLVVDALQRLMAICKQHETRPFLNALFKHSQPTLRLFMDQGMKSFDKTLRRHPAEVQDLLKRLQTVTRFLQTLCCHGKETGQMGLVQGVPNMRFLLEKLVQRVKSMLVVNGCTEAFWMGNLKNKNLRGEEIQTQMDEDEYEEEDEVDSEEERETQRRKRQKKKHDTQAGPSQARSTQAGPSRSHAGPSQRNKQASTSHTQKSKVSNTQKSKVSHTQKSNVSQITQKKKKEVTPPKRKRIGLKRISVVPETASD